MKIGDPLSKESRFIDASSDLEALFELKGIVRKELRAVIEHLLKKMPLAQRQPFLDEQQRLIAQLVVPSIAQLDVEAYVHNILPKAYARYQLFSRSTSNIQTSFFANNSKI